MQGDIRQGPQRALAFRAFATGLLVLAFTGIGAGTAFGQTGMSATPDPTPADPNVPSPMTVGDTFDYGLRLQNTSNAALGALIIAPGDILMTTSCGTVPTPFGPPCPNPDPVPGGVFSFSATGTGTGGSCAGTTFTIATATSGRIRFTSAAPVILATAGTFGDTCTIRFTATALNVPSLDADPGFPGTQTVALGEVQARNNSNPGLPASGTGSAPLTVRPPPPPPPPPPAQPCIPPPGPTPMPPGSVLCAETPPCIPPPGPTPLPPGRVLCAEKASPTAGTARISGPTGCVTQNFNVTVSGRHIRQVDFYLDGRLVKTLRRPNRGSRFVMPVRPDTLRRGTHRVRALTRFTGASKTRRRALSVVFHRCGRAARTPRFTG